MCGIAGLIAVESMSADRLAGEVRRMTDRLRHRGPDDEGIYLDASSGLCVGHRRLSILDLSPRGHQPMETADGRFVLTYNGEVYNFRALRAELSSVGFQFDGGSDTEVLLAALAHWGPTEALQRSHGMFALALYDRAERRLHLARDRVGKKPLYYGWVGHCFVFASELSAVRMLTSFELDIDRESLGAYTRYNAVPGTRTILSGFRKVEPGGIRTLDLADLRSGGTPRLVRYWSARDAVLAGQRDPFEGGPEDAVDELDRVLRAAVKARLESDVPLGAFLSGGVDSSLVVALMQAASDRPVRTFTIGFHVDGYDEARHAAAVARHLGTEHTELYLTPQDALEVIPSLPDIYDEPFCDVSQIPTYLVARLARRHVTVALSGDGGDELFAGYSRYPFLASLWRRFDRVPRHLRCLGGRALAQPTARRLLDGIARSPIAGRRFNSDRLLLLRKLLELDDPESFYRYLLSVWREDGPLVLGVDPVDVPELAGAARPMPRFAHLGELASYIDLLAYLPDDILVKVDRATMAVSLEARAPLLDVSVVELAWRLPFEWKVRDGQLKWPLAQLVRRYVPSAIMDRPKMGFGVPIGHWLRGPLRSWAEDQLAPPRLARDGFFDPRRVARRWHEHSTSRRDWSPELWAILMFQGWYDRFRGTSVDSVPRHTVAPT